MANRAQTQAAVQQVARQMAVFRRQRHAEEESLRRNPMIPSEGLPRVLGEFRKKTTETLDAMTAEIDALTASYRRASVLPPTDHRPSSAALAAHYAAVASLAPHWSPRVMERELRAAIAREDRGLLALLVPLAQSFDEYKRPFASATMASVLVDATAALVTPEAVASDEAAKWADALAHETKQLHTILSGPDPVAALDVNVQTGALPLLLPEGNGQ